MNTSRTYLSILVLYLHALFQGIAFTVIPSMGNLLLSHNGFNLLPSQYGTLFLPFALMTILSLFVFSILGKRMGIKSTLVTAAFFNILAMTILAFSQTSISQPKLSYPILLIVTIFLGAGLGANIISLNPFLIHYYPTHSKSAITALQVCFGLGASVGPLLFIFFSKFGIWWVDPFLIAASFLALLVASIERLPAEIYLETEGSNSDRIYSNSLFWNFAAVSLLYGFIETTFSNWSGIFLHHERSIEAINAIYALSSFWAAYTIGNIIFAMLGFVISPRYLYVSLPIIILASIVCIQLISTLGTSTAAFAISGLGCSAFLPLTWSIADRHFARSVPLVSGFIFSSYLIGYFLSGLFVGIAFELPISLSTVYWFLFLPTLGLGTLSFLLIKQKTN